MDLGLTGKVAWVLGASSGLGRASALSMARDGATVALSARGAERLRDAADNIAADAGSRTLSVPLDVRNADDVRAAAEAIVDELGPVDVLVANAGGPPPGSFEAFGDDELLDAFNLTTASAWRLTKAVLPAMRQRRSGCIVYITSASTKEVIPGLLLSNMMRAAVVGMAKTLSKEVAGDGVRVLCVAPGRIQTPRIDALDEATARREQTSPAEARAAAEGRIPLGRSGRPEEFGDVVAFLASERASYVTGVSLVVDGGMLNSM